MQQQGAKAVVSVVAVVGVEVVDSGSLEKEGPALGECGSWQVTVGRK